MLRVGSLNPPFLFGHCKKEQTPLCFCATSILVVVATLHVLAACSMELPFQPRVIRESSSDFVGSGLGNPMSESCGSRAFGL